VLRKSIDKNQVINNCPTRCDLFSLLFLLTALHVSGVDTHNQELLQL